MENTFNRFSINFIKIEIILKNYRNCEGDI